MTTPEVIAAVFDHDTRIVEVVHYEDGFVPNAYNWPAPGTRRIYRRDGSVRTEGYDRKRSRRGKWHTLVGRSAKGGCLYAR